MLPLPSFRKVKTGITLTEAVDIWSLGCTLFAMAYSTSPFETAQQSEHGGSIAMAALGGKYSFPDGENGRYSEGFKEIIRRCLQVKTQERADIDEVRWSLFSFLLSVSSASPGSQADTHSLVPRTAHSIDGAGPLAPAVG
jgi:serine/threonine protein kinase